MNSGSLHRFLAEAVWYPTVLIPSKKMQWQGIDEGTALATLTDNDNSVSLEFRFNEMCEISSIYTSARWGNFNGEYQQLPWEGHFRDYRTIDGLQIPMVGEVGWYFEGEWQPVWSGRIQDVQHETAH